MRNIVATFSLILCCSLVFSIFSCSEVNSEDIKSLNEKIEKLDSRLLQIESRDSTKKEDNNEEKIKEFEEALKKTFENQGFINYEFSFSEFMSISSRLNGSPDEKTKKLIDLGYLEVGEYLGESVIHEKLYNLNLTSKGSSMLLKTKTVDYNDGTTSYRWFFKVGRGRFKAIKNYRLIDENKVEINFTCEILEITEIGKKVFDNIDYEGEIKEYSEIFIKKGSNWIPKDVTSFGKGWYK
jgi:hypothetical protein